MLFLQRNMIKDILQTGIIERYCINDVSEEERAMVNQFSLKYKEVENEIKACKKRLTEKTSAKTPILSKVKYHLMRQIYESCAKKNPTFLPLMNNADNKLDWVNFISANDLNPAKDFEGNMEMQPLPSTIEIENAAVWIKGDFAEEVHHNENEFIYVVQGSCKMKLGGFEKEYNAGDMIFIPPFITHSAKVTSTMPMFALVQRQLLAQA